MKTRLSFSPSFWKGATDYATVFARDGQEAFELARMRRPDGCILDIDMPRVGGLELARMLQVEFGEQRPLLIALTGGPSLAEMTRSGCFDHVLRKPAPLDVLVKLLAEM